MWKITWEDISNVLYISLSLSPNSLSEISCKTLSQILRARKHCGDPMSDMKSIINVDFVEESRSNSMGWLSKLYDVLGKLSRRQYNEWCQYREKMFRSFYARRHELINVAFMFYIVDGIAKSPTHVTKFDYPAEMTDGLQSFDRKRFRHSVFADIYSDIRWKNDDVMR